MRPGLQGTDVQLILGAAQMLHRRMDLSGLLAYTDRHFFHVIEGPGEQVGALMGLIRQDPRHGQIRILCDEAIQSREHERWLAMPIASLDLADEVESLVGGQGQACEEARRLSSRLVSEEPDTRF